MPSSPLSPVALRGHPRRDLRAVVLLLLRSSGGTSKQLLNHYLKRLRRSPFVLSLTGFLGLAGSLLARAWVRSASNQARLKELSVGVDPTFGPDVVHNMDRPDELSEAF